MKKVIKLNEKDLYNIIEQIMNKDEIPEEQEVKEQLGKTPINYVVAQQKVDKFGNQVLVEPGTGNVLSVFTEN